MISDSHVINYMVIKFHSNPKEDARWLNGWYKRALLRVTALCSWAKCCTHTVPLPTHMYKLVLVRGGGREAELTSMDYESI